MRKLFVVSLVLCMLAVFAGCSGGGGSSDPKIPEKTYIVSFVKNGGTGTMYSDIVDEGENYTVPICEFAAPDGKEFRCWNDGTKDRKVGDKITVNKNITLKALWKTVGALDGVFTLSDNGTPDTSDDKRVFFSKGSLYYDGNTWNFEENQYDYRTYSGMNSCINGSVSSDGTPTDNWGLFGWSGDTGTAEWGMSISTDDSSYSGNFNDWGNNTINNGGGLSGIWKTLTEDELDYLFNGRTGAASKAGFAKVGDVNGIIILPDNFTDPMKNGGNGEFVPKSSTDWTANVYSTAGGKNSDWAAMEEAGAVFFPASGQRSGNVVSNVGNTGYSWSSTLETTMVWNLNFTGTTIVPSDKQDKKFGLSVRLVVEAD